MKSLRFADRLPELLPGDPMPLADAWLKEATTNAATRNPNAMTLATVGADGQPALRVVLCKQFVPDPGYAVFYTNYRSRKGRELAQNRRVAATFYWDNLGLQVRLEGPAVRSPASESDGYFATRDRGSQLGAWGSDQSAAIASHDALVRQIRERAEQLGVPVGTDERGQAMADAAPAIARPPHWGGVRIWIAAIELWVEGKDRIHDRAAWRRELVAEGEHGFSVSPWTGTRLQP